MKAIVSLAVVFAAALPAVAQQQSGDRTASASGTAPVVASGSGPESGKAETGRVHPKDSPLVRAAKATRAANATRAKPKKPIKVITNADVRKSPGKLTVLPPRPGMVQEGGAEQKPAAPGLLELQRRELETADRQAKRIADLKKATADLESALNRLEEEYYQSDDPMYRDTVIQKKFNETKKELEKSREELHQAQGEPKKSAETATAPPG